MREKILVVGAAGLVGQSLVYILDANDYNVVGAINNPLVNLPTRKVKLDISSPDEVDGVISSEKPDVIINVAGLIGFGKCEANPEEATKLNSEGVRYLIQSASSYNPLFVQFSTDAVFAGDTGFYSETNCTEPRTVYGRTKLQGDEIVNSSSLPFLIVRTSAVYGQYRYEKKEVRFIDSVLGTLSKGEDFNAMADTFNSPTFLDDLCEGVAFLLNEGVDGTFHLAGCERLSKYDFALKIANQFKLDPRMIIPVESKSLLNFSIYPGDISLNNSKIKQAGYIPCSIDGGLTRYAQQR